MFCSPSLNFFGKEALKEKALLIEGLWDTPKALLCLAALSNSQKNIVIVSGSRDDRLLDDLAFFSKQPILELLPWETLPGEEISPSADISGRRLEILYQLNFSSSTKIIHCSLQSLLQKTVSPDTLQRLCRLWHKGDEISFESIPSFLLELGYKKMPVAADKGEFAVRGGIIDIFPVSATEPYRLDFFGDILEQIRTYDPVGQKSIQKVPSLFISPASEWELLKAEDHPSLLWDYLGENTLIVFNELLSLEDHYTSLQSLPGSKTLFFSSFEDHLARTDHFQKIFLSELPIEQLSPIHIKERSGRKFYSGKNPLQKLSFECIGQSFEAHRWQHPFVGITDFFSLSENKEASSSDEVLLSLSRSTNVPLDLHILSSSEAEEKKLKDRIHHLNLTLPIKTSYHRGYLTSGFILSDTYFALLPQTELTHRYKARRQKWRSTYHTPASEFHELTPGDIVVHFHNGIGKFLGIETQKNHLGADAEFLIIEYAEKSKLYVPISQSHLVSRYIGSSETPATLSSLGSSKWQKTCIQAQKSIIGYAKELLERAANREIHGGFSCPEDSEEMVLFEEDFPFTETEDQIQAILSIKKDMISAKAMDRLICGDVGYGKTEVAMRAAFKAVMDGKKQVAVLVPTTILTLQHFENFKERMSNFALEIGMISRFMSTKDIKATLKKVQDGTLDILIGTHRIVSDDVQFKNLGLIIIDEEQRFGVRAKEHLKKAKVGVDCLTLSATPIPRTLYLSLIGAREISVINTPPQDRLPIKSILAERDAPVIQNALLRELSRDGQSYFIHNRVESIFQVKEELQKLVPQAKIVVGHGQMSADELDAVFHSFKSGNSDVLIATTIVENGVDIPNANTILIDKSDQFGMADLYQLRGRVGRWNRTAYAYFLTSKGQRLPEIARKRLQALIESSGHGGGMKVAMRDLEIRGAGDILGVQQSGQISAIGFHLYCKLLKKTVDAIKKNLPITFLETKIETCFDARLPDTYINEPSLRMEIYHRLGEASQFDEIENITLEMKDRFGPVPDPVLWLCLVAKIRLLAASRGIHFIKIEKFTMTTEKQKGKVLEKKTVALPQKKKPKEMEISILDILSR
ncbi:MAG: transcription-repair coupling factor [Chlamydiae bacterium]|nr:transcription-repair coupling factor [Chlamydiota bacterium]